MSSSVGSPAWRTAGLAGVVPGAFVAGFFVAAGFFFFAVAAGVARRFFFGSGGLVLPFAEAAAASSAGLFSSEVFGFLATVFLD